MTRPVQPERNPDGSIKKYAQRVAERKEIDNARIREQQVKQQEAKRAAAVAPPAPKPPSLQERQALRKSESDGRAIAEYEAEKKAKEAAADVSTNPYRARVLELDSVLYQPGMKKRQEHFIKLADQWDREEAERQAAVERQEKIDNDPAIKNARDYAAGLVKLAPEQFKTEAAECAGIAQAGDSQLAWSKMRDLEQRIWQHQDRLAAEKLAAKAVTDSEFTAAAEQAEAARTRFEQTANEVAV